MRPLSIMPDGWQLLCCYPIDVSPFGYVSETSRFVSLVRNVSAVTDTSDTFFLLRAFDYATPYSSRWIAFSDTNPVPTVPYDDWSFENAC